MNAIQLREIRHGDIDEFFLHQLDADANYMAAFTAKNPKDRNAFDLKWDMILKTKSIVKRTILYKYQIVGHIIKYDNESLGPEITYWIAKAFWGKGIASYAVREFLKIVIVRPIYARAVSDNKASIRVLEKCGFSKVMNDKGFANGRGEIVDEVLMMKTD